MTIPTLGRLVPVPLRQVWAREDSDFTPWLAQAENLSLLAETLSLGPLELQDTELPVGDCCIDILARDDDGNAVVVENQFGLSEHRHLGQIRAEGLSHRGSSGGYGPQHRGSETGSIQLVSRSDGTVYARVQGESQSIAVRAFRRRRLDTRFD